jgi:hypothetical protein
MPFGEGNLVYRLCDPEEMSRRQGYGKRNGFHICSAAFIGWIIGDLCHGSGFKVPKDSQFASFHFSNARRGSLVFGERSYGIAAFLRFSFACADVFISPFYAARFVRW